MSRLKHTPSGFVRFLQVSRQRLFVFVEGKGDRYLLGRLAEEACAPLAVGYEVLTSRELPGHDQGKASLEGMYAFLRRRGKLNHIFKSKRTIVVFYADKDLDDFLRRKRRSRYFVYTEGYEMENLLFANGEICEALAAASGFPSSEVKQRVDASTWCRDKAHKWIEWVVLCFVAATEGWSCRANYGRASLVHEGPGERLDKEKFFLIKEELRQASGLSSQRFETVWRRRTERVQKLFQNGDHDKIFKGKWYVHFVEKEAEALAGDRGFLDKRLGERVVTHLSASVDILGPWAGHLLDPMRNLVQELGQEG